MPGLTDSFGVALTAYTTLDKPSLDKAGKSIGDALGKKTSTAGTDQVDKKVQALTATTTSWAKRITDVKEQLRVDWHTSGLGKTVDKFRDAKTAVQEFHDQAEKTGKLFGSVGAGVFGLAGLGGIGAAVERFGSGSMQLRNTAGTLGVSTGTLQGFRGGAELAGLDQGAADTAIGALQRNLFAAKWGMPEGTQALGAAKILGLDVREDPTIFLKHLADKIKGQAPQIQREIAESFGVSELLPWLRRGSDAIDDLSEATKRHNYLSEQQIEQGNQLGEAYRGATQSISGMANAISAQLSPSLTPMLSSFSTWLDDMKKSPDAMKNVGAGVEVLSGLIGVTLVSGFAKLSWAATSWWALPAIKFLFQTGAGGALAVGGALGVLGMGINPIPSRAGSPEEATNAWRDNTWTPPAGYQPPLSRFWNWITSNGGGASSSGWGAEWWNRSHPGQRSTYNPAGIANLPAGLTTDDLAIMKRESRGNPNLGWGNTDLSNTPMDSTGFPEWSGKPGPAGNSTAFGLWQITGTNWHKYAPGLGIHEHSPESQLKIRRAMQAAAIAAGQPANIDWAASGDVLPVGPLANLPTNTAPAPTSGYSSAGPSTYSSLSRLNVPAPPAPPASTPPTPPAAPAPPPPAPSSTGFAGLTWDADGTPHSAAPAPAPGSTTFPYWVKRNSQGQPYELNMTADEKAKQEESYAYIKAHPTSWLSPESDYEPARNANTRHEVEINVNGPPGTVSNLKKANGRADLTLRTQTAFSSP